MADDKQESQNKGTDNCDMPSERSISEIVHEHLNNKDDHITDEDIKNAKINIEENELERDESRQPNENNGAENEAGKESVTPWDIIDDSATE